MYFWNSKNFVNYKIYYQLESVYIHLNHCTVNVVRQTNYINLLLATGFYMVIVWSKANELSFDT